jgi:hypothetical protein
MPGQGLHAAKMYGGRAPAANMFGGGFRAKPANIYGAGKNLKGMMPGHFLIPEEHIKQAMHNYKTLHNLHGRGNGVGLPHFHTHKIMGDFVNAPEGPDSEARGGFFQYLPMIASAALPFISEAVKGLVGGFSKTGGEHLANKIAGRGLEIGLPMPVHMNGQRHWHIHGAGFRDLLKRAYGKVKQVFQSEPIRKIGAHAITTLREALMNVILEKLDLLKEKATDKLGQVSNNLLGHFDQPEVPAHGYSEEEEPSAQNQSHEDPTGMGYKRRKPPTKKRPAKRSKNCNAFDPGMMY